MEILRKTQKEMLAIKEKNTIIKMKNAFEGLISRLHMAKKRISELEGVKIETSSTEKQVEKKKKNRISKNFGTATKSVTYIPFWEYQKKEKKRKEQKQYLKP